MMSTIGGGMLKCLKHKYQHRIPSENIPFVSTNLSSLAVVEGIKLDSLTTTCFTPATGGVLKALHIKGSLSCTSIIHHPKHQPGSDICSSPDSTHSEIWPCAIAVAGYPDDCVWDNGFLRGQLVSDWDWNSGNVGEMWDLLQGRKWKQR